jgi:hypothetical protein
MAMIASNIAREYPAHIEVCVYSDKSLFVADYTEQTKGKRGVEVFQDTPPADIDYFSLQNYINLINGFIVFDRKSFIKTDRNPDSQCECVVFPKESDKQSWIFFAELKYSNLECRNNKNIRKAINQLYKTRTYYFQKQVFSKSNTCYLFAALPMQTPPFVQSIVSPVDLLRLRRKHNVILRLQNHAEIKNSKEIIA